MFTIPKNEQVEVQGISVIFRYPTISDEIKIEAKKQVLSLGQYGFMNLSPMDSAQKALDLTDAIATLHVVARFPNNPEINVELVCDEDGKAFVLECYQKLQSWRSSFRKKDKGDDGAGDAVTADSKE